LNLLKKRIIAPAGDASTTRFSESASDFGDITPVHQYLQNRAGGVDSSSSGSSVDLPAPELPMNKIIIGASTKSSLRDG